jgi:long-chain acyl-CoA synthetase
VTSTVRDEHTDLSLIEQRARSVAHLFVERVSRTPTAEAFRFPRGASWESVTWAQTDARVRQMAAGLVVLGIESEQRVALASSTRYEWVLADLSVMLAGAATTTIYATTSESDVTYIARDSQSRIVFAEDDAQIAKLRANRSQLPDVVKVVTFDGAADGDWVISLADLEQLGAAHLAQAPTVVDERIAAIEPQHLATLIYTSGTTGRPKGVRLSHDCWTYEAAAIDAIGILTQDDLQYLWLPLAHVFGKVLLTLPLQIGFPTAVDGRVDKIVENLAVVSPTFMGAAPRIFEKAYGRIVTMMNAEGGLKARLFDWAIGVEPKPRTRERAAATAKSAIETVRLRIGPPVAVDFSNGRRSEPHQRARPVLSCPHHRNRLPLRHPSFLLNLSERRFSLSPVGQVACVKVRSSPPEAVSSVASGRGVR